jgi:hypothetical protein
MEPTSQLKALDRFLGVMYEGPVTLAAMLDELGFDPAQAQWLCELRMPTLAAALVEALRKRLTSGEKDLWFRLLNRRYGLDGEPALPLEQAAAALDVEPGYASQAQSDALKRCRTQTMKDSLRTDLHTLALAELKKAGGGPVHEDVVGKLKRLADLRAARDMTRLDYESKRAEVLKQVQAELDALESEYLPKMEAADQNADLLAEEIKNDVLLGGKTVSAGGYQAVYMKARVIWDSAGMSEYAELHPEVMKYRREGRPNVQIRETGKE